MHFLKLEISVNVFPHYFKIRVAWRKVQSVLKFLKAVSCSKIFNPNGF